MTIKADAKAQYLAAKRAALEAREAAKAEALRRKAEAIALKLQAGQAAREARITRFRAGEDWRHGAYSQRHYDSYDAYVSHQAEKLDGIKARLEGRWEANIDMFRKRFVLLPLAAPKSVLCLGARLGHEVAAFIELGHFAIGNDINPGEQNSYVVSGDFHKLVFADQSIDCVYINSVDHILDIPAFTSEVRRVLKPDGIFVADLVVGYEEGFWAGEYEALHWPRAADFAAELARIGKFELTSTRSLADVGSPLWLQCVYRKAPP